MQRTFRARFDSQCIIAHLGIPSYLQKRKIPAVPVVPAGPSLRSSQECKFLEGNDGRGGGKVFRKWCIDET